MLVFVGLGLYDEYSITLRGKKEIEKADQIFAELYTTKLAGTDISRLESFHEKPIKKLSRYDVEENPKFLDKARQNRIVFLVGGDPMISTTHSDLRIRAIKKDIKNKIVHAPSVETAVCGATGLQNYRFGKSTTLPFPKDNWKPTSPYKTVIKNLDNDLHTLIYLDITKERSMTANKAAKLLGDIDEENNIDKLVSIARLGTNSPQLSFGSPKKIEKTDIGPTPHSLIVPGSLHQIEEESLKLLSCDQKI